MRRLPHVTRRSAFLPRRWAGGKVDQDLLQRLERGAMTSIGYKAVKQMENMALPSGMYRDMETYVKSAQHPPEFYPSFATYLDLPPKIRDYVTLEQLATIATAIALSRDQSVDDIRTAMEEAAKADAAFDDMMEAELEKSEPLYGVEEVAPIPDDKRRQFIEDAKQAREVEDPLATREELQVDDSDFMEAEAEVAADEGRAAEEAPVDDTEVQPPEASDEPAAEEIPEEKEEDLEDIEVTTVAEQPEQRKKARQVGDDVWKSYRDEMLDGLGQTLTASCTTAASAGSKWMLAPPPEAVEDSVLEPPAPQVTNVDISFFLNAHACSKATALAQEAARAYQTMLEQWSALFVYESRDWHPMVALLHRTVQALVRSRLVALTGKEYPASRDLVSLCEFSLLHCRRLEASLEEEIVLREGRVITIPMEQRSNKSGFPPHGDYEQVLQRLSTLNQRRSVITEQEFTELHKDLLPYLETLFDVLKGQITRENSSPLRSRDPDQTVSPRIRVTEGRPRMMMPICGGEVVSQWGIKGEKKAVSSSLVTRNPQFQEVLLKRLQQGLQGRWVSQLNQRLSNLDVNMRQVFRDSKSIGSLFLHGSQIKLRMEEQVYYAHPYWDEESWNSLKRVVWHPEENDPKLLVIWTRKGDKRPDIIVDMDKEIDPSDFYTEEDAFAEYRVKPGEEEAADTAAPAAPAETTSEMAGLPVDFSDDDFMGVEEESTGNETAEAAELPTEWEEVA
eukprot:Sspe_Gene.18420::Locus_6609_Transcript_1_1_Confidence_1.000_Length_3119::g.18420::m.18420